jgi:Fe-Mn family superoxide dismutase
MRTSALTRRDMIGGGAAGMTAAFFAPGLLACGEKENTRMSPSLPLAKAEYTARDYGGLVGATPFEKTLLENHFNLYQGYVKNTNDVLTSLSGLAKEKQLGTPAAAGMRRRLGWEFNGMRLHELYFENLGGKEPLKPDSKAGQAIAKNFGSIEAWTADFKATGAMRGIGWAALVLDAWTGRLFNTWINEHDGGHLGACPIVLIMDVFEHAFITQYGLKRADYIEAFFTTIHWGNVEKRL